MTAGIMALDRQTTRKLRFFLRLRYPVRITAEGDRFAGCYPDLPGCGCVGHDPTSIYAELEQARRAWVTRQLLAGCEVPMPNSHLRRQQRVGQGGVAEPTPRLFAVG